MWGAGPPRPWPARGRGVPRKSERVSGETPRAAPPAASWTRAASQPGSAGRARGRDAGARAQPGAEEARGARGGAEAGAAAAAAAGARSPGRRPAESGSARKRPTARRGRQEADKKRARKRPRTRGPGGRGRGAGERGLCAGTPSPREGETRRKGRREGRAGLGHCVCHCLQAVAEVWKTGVCRGTCSSVLSPQDPPSGHPSLEKRGPGGGKTPASRRRSPARVEGPRPQGHPAGRVLDPSLRNGFTSILGGEGAGRAIRHWGPGD